MIGAVRCLLLGRHQPVRQLLGGFRCTRCGTAGLDLAQMGFPEIGYVKSRQWRAGVGI